MVTDKATVENKEFEAIYKLYVDSLYKYCLYYLKDEEKAKDTTLQAFLNFYQYYETVTSDAVFKCLVCEAKNLLSYSQHQELAKREVLE